MDKRKIEVSGYAGYWTASCWCGWVSKTYRSVGVFTAEDKARREADAHTCKSDD